MAIGYDLLAIYRTAEQYLVIERGRGPLSCPRCGEPLIPTGKSVEGAGARFCRFDGYRWPEDGWGEVGEPH